MQDLLYMRCAGTWTEEAKRKEATRDLELWIKAGQMSVQSKTQAKKEYLRISDRGSQHLFIRQYFVQL